jgi:hypothetical protein
MDHADARQRVTHDEWRRSGPDERRDARGPFRQAGDGALGTTFGQSYRTLTRKSFRVARPSRSRA